MNFATWEPAYEAVLADLGFARGADEAAAETLAGLTGPFDEARLEALLADAHVAVAGGGPGVVRETASTDADVVVAASVAAGALRAADIPVDVMVTDLDKTPAVVRTLAAEGTPVVVHAHGDNRGLVRQQVPALAAEQVLPTTQAAPTGPVRNYGGFTDGDRAAFLADHFGAARLSFPGWDVADPAVGPVKRRKLAWAARLLRWLEIRRDERFAVLDGRRDGLSLDWL